MQPRTSLFDPNKTCGQPTDVIMPGPFPAGTKQLSESGLLYSPTTAKKQTVVMKQKDVENRVSMKTVRRPSPGVFFKIHLKGLHTSLLTLCVFGGEGVHLALISWLL